MTSTERVLALLAECHWCSAYNVETDGHGRCTRCCGVDRETLAAALRRIVEQHAPGDEPRIEVRDGKQRMQQMLAHAVWQERTAILRAIEEELSA